MIAPLSGRECVHYYILIEQEHSSEEDSSWSTLYEEEKHCDYLINDNGNLAILKGNSLKSHIVQDKNYSSGIFDDAPEKLESFLNSKGIKSTNFFGFNKTIRYKEGIFEINEKIAVYGQGNWKNISKISTTKKVLEITGHEQEAIYLSDEPQTFADKSIN